MSERASIFEGVQIGVESSAGTEVNAVKKLEAYQITPNYSGSIDSFRGSGFKFPSLVTVGKEMTEASLEGVLDYNCLTYMLASLVNYAAPSQVGTLSAYTWTFTPDSDGPDTVKTYTIERGSSVRAQQFEYGMVTGLSFSFSAADSQIAVSGSIIGTELRDGITMTPNPTVVEAVPATVKQATVKLAATQAGLAGASALARVLAAEWHYNDKFKPVYVVDSNDSFTVAVESEASLGGSITLEADTEGSSFLTQLRAGTQYWIEKKWVGAAIGTTTYNLVIQMPIHFTAFPSMSDQDGVVAKEYQYVAVHDGTWGKALNISLTNAVADL